MSLNILVISHMYPNPANPMSGIFVHNQVKALKALEVNCQVVSPIPRFPFYPKWRSFRRFPKVATMDGIPIRYVPTWMFPGGLFFQAYGYLYFQSLHEKLEKLRECFPFDLIHCHTIYPDGYAGSLLKKTFQVPVVSTIHGSDIRIYPFRSRGVFARTESALRTLDHVVTVSQRLKRDAQQIVAGVEAVTIYNGFDPQRFYPRPLNEARQKLGLPKEKKHVLFIGNFYKVKGIEYLLQAFAKLIHQSVDVQLYLLGDGPLRSQLKKQARESGIQKNVQFVGRKPHDEIPWWINSCDVVVLPSLSEGLPSVLLEAMGCGKPVVATDVGGISEVLQHRKTGFLVEPKNPEALAHCLSTLLVENEELARDMGERAYSESGSYTWQKNAEKMKGLYQDLL
ncbi:glycosyltransferase family 4 protein [Melghirimyces algeriensis]|uniref:Glycosyltransferase involved in cell wall bisynthesis n=1 Tax=Melghirimyces algeriensis TaxID=910412 RepID=A0A521D4R1_9BACL|nr:glycosyltransferase family 4 protein [Melghirimyces algeriensis]SMO66657.1 Glycosyltransferase involved in cell wall bisynthesis [Melghirimyces algeriensis]